MNEELFKYIIKVLIFVLLIFALIIFVNSLGLNLNENPIPKKLIQSVTIEGLTNYEGLTNTPDTSIIQNKNDAFCESHRGSSHILNESCSNLTKHNCIILQPPKIPHGTVNSGNHNGYGYVNITKQNLIAKTDLNKEWYKKWSSYLSSQQAQKDFS